MGPPPELNVLVRMILDIANGERWRAVYMYSIAPPA